MQSRYIHNECHSCGQSAPELNGLAGDNPHFIINNYYFKLHITGRHPKQGNPAPGIPFSLDVQGAMSHFDTWGDIFWSWDKCPDMPVVARGASSGRIWAFKYISTGILNNCWGSGTLLFDLGFKPSIEKIVFQIYDDDQVQTISDVQGNDPLISSKPINLGLNQEKGRDIGIYGQHKTTVISDLTHALPSFGQLNGFLGKALIIGGVGAGLYFLWPFMPEIKMGFDHLAGDVKKHLQTNEPITHE
jgi:hypothetical protein